MKNAVKMARVIVLDDGIRNINEALKMLPDKWEFSPINPKMLLINERYEMAQEKLKLKKVLNK